MVLESPILWPPHAKSLLIGKDSDAGRDWGQEEKGTTEGEMAGWHHRLNGHEPLETRPDSPGEPGMENPRDGGAWWAALYGIAQSRTRLK